MDCLKLPDREVLIVDTPGLFDTTTANFDIMETIKTCVKLSLPGTTL